MPIYEFICPTCHKRLSFLVRDSSAPFAPKCSSCGSADLSRIVSCFAYHKSLKTVWDDSGEPGTDTSEDYYKDPRNIGRWAEKRFHEAGQELPSHIQQKIQAARQGVLPEPLKDLESASPTSTYD
jgi:putative FmdB family regulatory protein